MPAISSKLAAPEISGIASVVFAAFPAAVWIARPGQANLTSPTFSQPATTGICAITKTATINIYGMKAITRSRSLSCGRVVGNRRADSSGSGGGPRLHDLAGLPHLHQSHQRGGADQRRNNVGERNRDVIGANELRDAER